MSILNVNTIQPVGSGQTITVSAADISAPSTVVTASSFVGNVNATGVSTFSDTVNVGAGKSVRIFGSASGYSDIIASSAAGASELLLPNTSGTLDRLNRAGNILQVVNATYSTNVSSSSATYADTGLTASITPTSASSKILVLVDQTGCRKSADNTYIGLRLLRDTTAILNFIFAAGYTNSAVIQSPATCSCCYLDSPATTSSVTYKTQFNNGTATGSVNVQVSNDTSTITLLEVAA